MKTKNITKILGILVFFALIGISINAQPINLTDDETSYAEEIVNSYINSPDINLTNYTLKVVPIAFFVDEKKLVNVFLFPEKPTEGLIKFIVDLNKREVIKNFTKPCKDELFGKSKQNKQEIKEALRIANENSEIKKQFALLNFTKIPHIQSCDKIKAHLIFVPMNAYEKVESELERKYNVSAVDVNISIEDKKVLRYEIKEMPAEDNGEETQDFAEDKTEGDSETPENNAASMGDADESEDNEGDSNNENNENTGNDNDKPEDTADDSNNETAGNDKDKSEDTADDSNNETSGNDRDKSENNADDSNNENNENAGNDKDKSEDTAGDSNNENKDNAGGNK